MSRVSYQPPTASVIIPTYNQARLVTRAVDSVLAQSFTDYEIIVVDDGSADETSRYLAAQPGLRVIRNPANRGPSVARNQGLTAARGRYVAFLDGDDLFTSLKLAAQVPQLDANPALGMVFGDIQFCDEHDRDLPCRYSDLRRPHPGPDIFEALTYENFIPLHALLIRRECLQATGGFDETMRWAEDWHLWLRLAARYPAWYQSVIVGKYRVHGGNTSRHRLNLTSGNAVVRRWLIGSPLFGRLSLATRYACYLSGAISLTKLGEMAEARHYFAEARRLRPFYPSAYTLAALARLGPGPFRAIMDRMRQFREWMQRTPQPFGARPE